MIKDLNCFPFIPDSDKKRVVVVGGGFAGMAAIKKLLRANFQVVLIDKNNYHQFQPLIYQVATSSLEPTSISAPLRRIFRGKKNFSFLMAEVLGVDKATSMVETSLGGVHYDYLIIAAGATTNYFSMKEIEEKALPLKTIPEALAVRNRIYKNLEFISTLPDCAEREPYLNLVIVGGGPTGVELAGAIAELKRNVLPKEFPDIDFSKLNIYLLDAADRLLTTFSRDSSDHALRDLTEMGVKVRLGTKVKGYDSTKHTVLYNENDELPTKNLIWASGIVANKMKGLETIGRGGRIITDAYCRESENIYVIGDVAIIEGYELPQVAQVALQQGRYVADAIINGAKDPFKYKDKGSMATIGRNKAVAEAFGMKFKGFPAWVVWLFIHLMYIVGYRNRLLVLWNWFWNYVTEDQPLGSIIEIREKDKEAK